MKRDQKLGIGVAFVSLLAAGVNASACSAGGGDEKTFGSGTGNAPGGGNVPNGTGNVPTTGNVPNFGSGGVSFNEGSGGSIGPGAGGVGGVDIGDRGPSLIERCADAARFQGAAGNGGMRLTYPYPGTVFPRGLAAPPIMWDGAAPSDVLVEIRSNQFTYRECVAVTDAGRFQIPDDVWRGAGAWSGGGGDPVHMTVTGIAGGAPISVTQDIVFALATMKGAIYYNTYDSLKVNHNGAVLKILPGDKEPTVFLSDAAGIAPLGPCYSCHSVSANGATMTANHHFYPGVYESRGYDISNGTAQEVSAGIPEAGFAAIFRDGTKMLTNGPPKDSLSIFFPTAPGNVAALVKAESKLLDLQGGVIPSNWDVLHAQMPMFSPDGTRIVYNDADAGAGHSLWVAEFDTNSNQFSNKREIFNDATRFPSWPFFTPDSRQVVFALGTNDEFVSQLPDVFVATAALRPPSRGKLYIVDVDSKQPTELAIANGFQGAGGPSYLPAQDNDWEYFTTMSPVAAGGFYWALFTSRRTYGSIWAPAKEDPKSKKIWVTAISIGTPPGTDPSHPAFLLPGQEIESGNVRAFAALEPCKEDGQSCTSGTDCCSGYCSDIDPVTGVGRCGIKKIDECSTLDNVCTSDADCCKGPDNGAHGRDLRCLNGYCGEIFK